MFITCDKYFAILLQNIVFPASVRLSELAIFVVVAFSLIFLLNFLNAN